MERETDEGVMPLGCSEGVGALRMYRKVKEELRITSLSEEERPEVRIKDTDRI